MSGWLFVGCFPFLCFIHLVLLFLFVESEFDEGGDISVPHEESPEGSEKSYVPGEDSPSSADTIDYEHTPIHTKVPTCAASLMTGKMSPLK